MYYRGSAAAVIVYDITKLVSITRDLVSLSLVSDLWEKKGKTSGTAVLNVCD